MFHPTHHRQSPLWDIGRLASAGLLAALAAGALFAASRPAQTIPPVYSESSVLNSIDPEAPLAVNGYVSIYGKDLAWEEQALAEHHLRNGFLPTSLGGVSVTVDGLLAHLLYVSPTQVNFVVPNILLPGKKTLRMARDGTAGPAVSITLAEVAPALFALDEETVQAVHLDGSLVTREAPADPGEEIVIFASGLGQTLPRPDPGELPTWIGVLARRDVFQVLLDGQPCERILYAGVAPGYAGLYQVNFVVPEDATGTPELRLAVGDARSQENLRLPLSR